MLYSRDYRSFLTPAAVVVAILNANFACAQSGVDLDLRRTGGLAVAVWALLARLPQLRAKKIVRGNMRGATGSLRERIQARLRVRPGQRMQTIVNGWQRWHAKTTTGRVSKNETQFKRCVQPCVHRKDVATRSRQYRGSSPKSLTTLSGSVGEVVGAKKYAAPAPDVRSWPWLCENGVA